MLFRSGYDTNSTGNGWYEKDDKIVTGQYQINNIYDMAGNVYEWTTENCIDNGNSYSVDRGGRYYFSGSNSPACMRDFHDKRTFRDVGFRVVLYK